MTKRTKQIRRSLSGLLLYREEHELPEREERERLKCHFEWELGKCKSQSLTQSHLFGTFSTHSQIRKRRERVREEGEIYAHGYIGDFMFQ